MKICHITAEYPPMVGGISKHVYELSQEQAKRGHDVTILCPDDIGDVNKIALHSNIKITKLKSFGRPLNNPLVPSIIFKLKNDFDIVHGHDYFFFGTMLASLMSKLRKWPFVVTYHTDNLFYKSTFKQLFQKLYIHLIGKKVLQTANRVISVNKEMDDSIKDQGYKTKIINYGIYLEKYKLENKKQLEKIKRKYYIKKNEKVLLFVGRLVPRKGLFDLLDSFEKLIRQQPLTKLIIVGTGPLLSKLKFIARKKHLQNRVIFTGKLSFKKVIPFYHLANLFVFPSYPGETQGIVLLEALACNTPIIVSNLPGVRSVVKRENGQLFEYGNKKQLTKKILYMLKNPSKGDKEFIKLYDWKNIYNKFNDLYNKLYNENKNQSKKFYRYHKLYSFKRFFYEVQQKKKSFNFVLKQNQISKKNQKVLDIGFGFGEMLSLFKKSELYGVDKSKIAVEKTKIKYSNSNFSQLDLSKENLPFNNNFFDIIIASHVLEHIPNSQKILGQIYKKLSLNGKAIILLPINENVVDKEHCRTYSKEVIKKELEKANFSIIYEYKNDYLRHFYNNCKKSSLWPLLIIPMNLFLAFLPFEFEQKIDKILRKKIKPQQYCLVCKKMKIKK